MLLDYYYRLLYYYYSDRLEQGSRRNALTTSMDDWNAWKLVTCYVQCPCSVGHEPPKSPFSTGFCSIRTWLYTCSMKLIFAALRTENISPRLREQTLKPPK